MSQHALMMDGPVSMAARTPSARPLKVLFLSRNYPSNVLPLAGLWVEGLVRTCAKVCETKVIAPVPYCPPFPGLGEQYTRFRTVPRSRFTGEVEVFHPRFLIPPGYLAHGVESVTYYLAVTGLVGRLHKRFPFDVIHAQFSFPDGWVATRLGRRFGVPVVITEHALWKPWMDNFRAVRRQAVWAGRNCSFHVAVSRALRDQIAGFAGESEHLRVIPNGVDGSLFSLSPRGTTRKRQILFVGLLRHVKGADILLKAMQLLARRGRDERLLLIGAGHYSSHATERDQLRQMAVELGLGERVEFLGSKCQAEVARYMQESAALVSPSRRESLGMVLVEALACGTPVVATHCGGTEDIVSKGVGVLVPPEDPEALADGIESVLDRPGGYDPMALRTHALENFAWERVTAQYIDLYHEAIARQ